MITHHFTHDSISNTIEHTILNNGVPQGCRNYSAIQRDELLVNSSGAASANIASAGWTDAYIATKIAEEQAATATAEEQRFPKTAVIAQAKELREKILNRLTGIQLNTTNPAYITAMQTARQALLDFPANPAVVAAVTGAQTKTAIMTIWYQTGTTLATAAPPAATAFTGMGL